MQRRVGGTIQKAFVRYSLATLAVVASFILRRYLIQHFGMDLPPYILAYPAVTICAVFEGLGSGLFATALGALITDYFLLGPLHHFHIADAADGVALAIFVSMGTIMSVLAEFYRQTQRRLRSQQARSRAESKFKELTESIHDRFIGFDSNLRITYWNKSVAESTGVSAEQALGKTRAELFGDTEAVRQVDDACRKALLTRQPTFCETLWPVHGQIRSFEIENFPSESGISTIIRDVTDRKAREEQIQRLTRVYSVLSDINQTIVREKNSQAMLEAVCRIAVEKGKFRMAWIGKADPTTNQLQPVAFSGTVAGYLDDLCIDLGNSVSPGPAATAFRTDQHFICNDIESDPTFVPWREEALRRGYRSSGAFPLRCMGETVGILSLYACEADFFNADELALLDEMAMDISFALDVNHLEKYRLQQEEELRWRTAFFEAQAEASPDGILVVDAHGKKLLQNERMKQLFRLPASIAEDDVDSNQLQFVTRLVKDPEAFLSRVNYLYAHEDESGCDEMEFIDGTVLERYSSPVQDAAGRYYGRIWTLHDITARRRVHNDLRDSLESLKEAESIGNLGSYSLDIRTVTWTSSAVLDQIFGIDEQFARTIDGWTMLVHPDDRDMIATHFQQEVLGQSKPFEKQYRIIRRCDGEMRWVHGLGRLSFDAAGHPIRMRGVIRDITANVQSLEALRASDELYRTAFQINPDFITISKLSDGEYIDVNRTFLERLGYQREEFIGHTPYDLNLWVDPPDRERMFDIIKRDESCRNFQTRFRAKNGDILWATVSAALIEHNGDTCLYAITRDISESKEAESRIEHLAFYDSLTGLPNRLLLLDRLQQAIAGNSRNAQMRALLFIDLDNFKTLNDTYGHDVGDLQLQEVAHRLSSCVVESDTVARLGGDEFVVMLENLTGTPEEAAAQTTRVANTILLATSQPYLLNGREHHSTVSIGINVFGDRSGSIHDVLKHADIAMYQAKLAGRNTVSFFAPALQAAVNSRALLEDELRKALRAKQFLLHYQPQVEHGQVVGAEALIRWNHPQRGTILPGEFMPLAEQMGLVLPIGAWVLESACERIAEWSNDTAMAHVSIAVNISALQLRQPDFVEQVMSALRRTGAKPCNLKLELTESMMVDNIEDVIAKMTTLKANGVGFSLDDFGTGFSSLSYLKRLPLAQLKIDRSFVRDILSDCGSGAIAKSIISLGRALEMSVIAEGVETEEQRSYLDSLGCHTYQGFLFSRAVPWLEFESMLASAASACL